MQISRLCERYPDAYPTNAAGGASRDYAGDMTKVMVLVAMLAACGVEDADRTALALPTCAELGAPQLEVCQDDGTCSSFSCDSGVCTWEGASCVDHLTLDVMWSASGTSDSRGVPDPVVCTDTISHPCPFLLYTQTLFVAHTRAVWKDATGGTDEAGVKAEDRPAWVDEVSFVDGAIVIPQRGDDGGLRHEAVLTPTSTGYEGEIAWTLFTVAGTTTFHVTLARR